MGTHAVHCVCGNINIRYRTVFCLLFFFLPERTWLWVLELSSTVHSPCHTWRHPGLCIDWLNALLIRLDGLSQLTHLDLTTLSVPSRHFLRLISGSFSPPVSSILNSFKPDSLTPTQLHSLQSTLSFVFHPRQHWWGLLRPQPVIHLVQRRLSWTDNEAHYYILMWSQTIWCVCMFLYSSISWVLVTDDIYLSGKEHIQCANKWLLCQSIFYFC